MGIGLRYIVREDKFTTRVMATNHNNKRGMPKYGWVVKSLSVEGNTVNSKQTRNGSEALINKNVVRRQL